MRWNYYKLRQLSLLRSAIDGCYKLRQLFYYKVRHGILQIATGITKCDGFITNCDRYYKVRWLLQIATVQGWRGISSPSWTKTVLTSSYNTSTISNHPSVSLLRLRITARSAPICKRAMQTAALYNKRLQDTNTHLLPFSGIHTIFKQ